MAVTSATRKAYLHELLAAVFKVEHPCEGCLHAGSRAFIVVCSKHTVTSTQANSAQKGHPTFIVFIILEQVVIITSFFLFGLPLLFLVLVESKLEPEPQLQPAPQGWEKLCLGRAKTCITGKPHRQHSGYQVGHPLLLRSSLTM